MQTLESPGRCVWHSGVVKPGNLRHGHLESPGEATPNFSGQARAEGFSNRTEA